MDNRLIFLYHYERYELTEGRRRLGTPAIGSAGSSV